MILDRNGGIVWYSPNTGFPASQGQGRMDLKVQSYRGQPVLTWWEGQIIKGYGDGKAVIADSSYRTIATVKAGNGLQADLHEFVISPQDTALITVYRQVTTDLSKVGGPAKGVALSGVVQEIDIATGKVLFEWDSLDHVPVTDTYAPFTGGTKDGRSAFHGGAFASAGRAWALLGDRGAGKSSTLAALAAAGVGVVTDDLLVVDGSNVFAGPRVLDLRPDMASELNASALTVRAGARHRLELSQVPAELPLAGWVFLNWGRQTTLRRVAPGEWLERATANLNTVTERAPSLLGLAGLEAWELSRPRDLASLQPAVEKLRALVER